MSKGKIVKAELFPTRRCDLNCGYCGFTRDDGRREMNTWDMLKAIDICADYGASVIIVYGGEPLLRFHSLLEMIEYCKSTNLMLTVISNCQSLTLDKIDQLVDAGLQSWGISADSLRQCFMDGHTANKGNKGIWALGEFRKRGVPDLTVHVTLHNKNAKEFPKLCQSIRDMGYWVHIDLLHHARPGCEKGTDWKLNMNDEVINALEAVKGIDKLFVPDEIIDELKKGLVWKCSYPAWFTVDSNGQMMACPDRNGKRTYRKHIFDMEVRGAWDAYHADFLEDVRDCEGCAWSTTILSEWCQLRGPEYAKKVMTHVERGK